MYLSVWNLASCRGVRYYTLAGYNGSNHGNQNSIPALMSPIRRYSTAATQPQCPNGWASRKSLNMASEKTLWV
jgi:hypothetical protein